MEPGLKWGGLMGDGGMSYCWELGLEGRPPLRADEGDPVQNRASSGRALNTYLMHTSSVSDTGDIKGSCSLPPGVFDVQMCTVNLQGRQSLGGIHFR